MSQCIQHLTSVVIPRVRRWCHTCTNVLHALRHSASKRILNNGQKWYKRVRRIATAVTVATQTLKQTRQFRCLHSGYFVFDGYDSLGSESDAEVRRLWRTQIRSRRSRYSRPYKYPRFKGQEFGVNRRRKICSWISRSRPRPFIQDLESNNEQQMPRFK